MKNLALYLLNLHSLGEHSWLVLLLSNKQKNYEFKQLIGLKVPTIEFNFPLPIAFIDHKPIKPTGNYLNLMENVKLTEKS